MDNESDSPFRPPASGDTTPDTEPGGDTRAFVYPPVIQSIAVVLNALLFDSLRLAAFSLILCLGLGIALLLLDYKPRGWRAIPLVVILAAIGYMLLTCLSLVLWGIAAFIRDAVVP